MSRWVLVLALWWTAAAEDARRAQRAEVARVDAIKGALAEPCWATARNNERRLCASLDEVLEADAGGELGTVGVVIAWCADDFHWVGDVLRMVAACVEIKILRRVRRVVLHAIDATPARWRGDIGSSPLDGTSTAVSSPRNDLVKNYRAPNTLVDFHTGRGELAPGREYYGVEAARRVPEVYHL